MTMPNPNARVTITEDVLRRYLGEGLSLSQMTERWHEETGEYRHRSSFANAMRRKGIESPRKPPRHLEEVPWNVKIEHQAHTYARLLRMLGRRNKNMPNTVDANQRLDSLLKWLDEENAVIHYEPDTLEGFFAVPREPDDIGYVRNPKKSA